MQTTLLTEDQIWGNSALDVMKNYGIPTGISDLAIALGGYRSSGTRNIEGDYTGYPWSASATYYSFVRVVNRDGDQDL